MINWLLQNDISNLSFYVLLGSNLVLGFSAFNLYASNARLLQNWKASLKRELDLVDEFEDFKRVVAASKMGYSFGKPEKLSE